MVSVPRSYALHVWSELVGKYMYQQKCVGYCTVGRYSGIVEPNPIWQSPSIIFIATFGDSIKAGFWNQTALDCELDWTGLKDGADQNTCIQTTIVTKATMGSHCLCLKFLFILFEAIKLYD